ncbi:MAG: hypothetical protein ACRDN0_34675, partial [Trebonia sp.]
MTTAIRCGRCKRRFRKSAKDADQWNVTTSQGVITDFTCPGCQSSEENAEAEINLATLDYSVDPFGRSVARPKRPAGAELAARRQ